MATKKPFNLRLSAEDRAAIRHEAARQKKSESELTREWLEPYLRMIRRSDPALTDGAA